MQESECGNEVKYIPSVLYTSTLHQRRDLYIITKYYITKAQKVDYKGKKNKMRKIGDPHELM
jgi:hypothetical protein